MIKNAPSATPRELIFVAKPDAGLRVRRGKVISLKEGVDVAPLAELLSAGDIAIRPLYGVSEEWLLHKTAPLDVRMGDGQPLDLSVFYKVTAPDEMLEELGSRLRSLHFVQTAYIKPGVNLPFIDRGEKIIEGPPPPIPTDDFTKHQEYLNAASEGGIDARYAWGKKGGRGRGVSIIDIEGAWRFSHEDLLENPGGCVGGIPTTKLKARRHGTAVLGLLGGDHNGFGIAGICPEADVNTVSVFGNSDGDPSTDWSYAAAIRLAADMLRPGDIMLIELHQPGPAVNFEESDSQRGYIPVEWWPCNMAAILYANSRGIIVVEAGGNGRENLDDEIYDKNPCAPHGPFPDWWRNPFTRDPIDTGAILVGAGAPPEGIHDSAFGVARSRLAFSNFGYAIDTQGWGEEVATCGGDNSLTPSVEEEDRRYTIGFNGTSSAAAMVAGALGCLQGILRARGRVLEPARARRLLQDARLGSPQQAGDFAPLRQHIGPLPDLRKLITHLSPGCALKRWLRALKRALIG